VIVVSVAAVLLHVAVVVITITFQRLAAAWSRGPTGMQTPEPALTEAAQNDRRNRTSTTSRTAAATREHLPAENLKPEAGQPGQVVCVDHDLVEGRGHAPIVAGARPAGWLDVVVTGGTALQGFVTSGLRRNGR
jgi:hypothetical protein